MARGDSKTLSQNQPKLSCPLDMILVMKTVITMIMLVNCDTMSQKNKNPPSDPDMPDSEQHGTGYFQDTKETLQRPTQMNFEATANFP